MPLVPVDASHIRVTCDACRKNSAEVCGRRDPPVMARVAAVRKFRAQGWHHDPGSPSRTKTLEESERDGAGRWYCPECGSARHL